MKMYLFILFTLSCLISFSQNNYFEGKITYHLQYLDPESGEDVSSQFQDLLGSEKHFYIDSANYKKMNQANELLQLYNSANQTVYVQNSNSGHILEIDATTILSRVTEVAFMDAGEEVFGKYCNRVIIKTSIDQTTYWFDPTLKVQKDHFLQHTYENWGAYMYASNGALPLKYKYEGAQYMVIGTVTKIEPMKLPFDTFKLPFPVAAE